MTYTETTYTGPDCSGSVSDVETRVVEFSVGESTTSLDGESVKQMDAKVTDYYFQIFNQDEFNTVANQLREMCDSNVSLGAIIAEKNCNVSADRKMIGLQNSGIYQVSEGVFYSNWGGPGNYPPYLAKQSIWTEEYYKTN